MNDLYQKFAVDYDEFGRIEDYLGDEKNFLQKIFVENNVEKVLDCACGTGQHLLMLSDLGYIAFGSDYSKEMLSVAKNNLKKHNYNIPLRQCDFRLLENTFDEKFDAVLCMTNSLPHLHEDEDLICALKSMKNRLRSGGIIILSSGTTEANLKLPPIEVVVNREDFSRIFIKEYDGKLQTINIVDLFHSKERIESNQYKIVYRVLFNYDYKELLSKAGFKKVDIYGDYSGTPYDKNSRRIIVVARI